MHHDKNIRFLMKNRALESVRVVYYYLAGVSSIYNMNGVPNVQRSGFTASMAGLTFAINTTG